MTNYSSDHNADSASERTDTPVVEEVYALVEIMGHDKMIGRIQEVPYCGTTMLRVETLPLPEEPERIERDGFDFVYEKDEDGCRDYDTGKRVPGHYVRRAIPAQESRVRMLGGAAIFGITPMPRDQALALTLAGRHRPQAVFVPKSEIVDPPKITGSAQSPVTLGEVMTDVFGASPLTRSTWPFEDREEGDLCTRRLQS